jgi:hypothetical protein
MTPIDNDMEQYAIYVSDDTYGKCRDWPLEKLIEHVRMAAAENGYAKVYNEATCEYSDTVEWSDERWEQERGIVRRLDEVLGRKIAELNMIQDELVNPWRHACIQHDIKTPNARKRAPAAASTATKTETGAAPKRKGGRPKKVDSELEHRSDIETGIETAILRDLNRTKRRVGRPKRAKE